jgi:hypothetical protein
MEETKEQKLLRLREAQANLTRAAIQDAKRSQRWALVAALAGLFSTVINLLNIAGFLH